MMMQNTFEESTFCFTSINIRLDLLALRHCLRFSCAVFPGGAAADNSRGRTAWIADEYTPQKSPAQSDILYSN